MQIFIFVAQSFNSKKHKLLIIKYLTKSIIKIKIYNGN